MTIGRVANLTQPHNGRGGCQYRNRCIRGCPYGAYFSSNAATLPAAYATGKLTLRPFSIVTELIYDANTKRATGVRIVDAETNQTTEYFARVIFLCASAIASTFILLNSTSDRFPNGLGNDSGELGHNLMDHHFIVGAPRRVRRIWRSVLQGAAAERHLYPAVPEPRREVPAEGLPPRFRLSGQRESRRLGARHQGVDPVSAQTSKPI